jgi:manganese-dependent inorganic pyrophosphatase
MIQVFGHKSPDTDSTGSPLIWAWYLNEVKGTPAHAVLLGQPNTEAAFVLRRWGFETPEIIADVEPGAPVSSSTPTTPPNCRPRSARPISRPSSTTTS